MYSDSESRVEVAIYSSVETSLDRSTLEGGSNNLTSRIVVQIRSEPAFNFGHRHPLACRVVGDLIAVDLAQAEVTRFRVGEVETTYARAGPHREGLRNQ